MANKFVYLPLVLLLAACGGGGGSGGSAGNNQAAPLQGCSYALAAEPDVTDNGTHPTAAQAARFLQQASFGGTPTGIAELQTGSFQTWLTRQFAQPQTSHLTCVDQESARISAAGNYVGQEVFLNSFWGQALTRSDQLRQRMAFALSQIMVVSYEGTLSENHRGVASYYDMLGRNAFGNFRTLLEDVSLHPAMGAYLSHLRNQKENTSGRVPDENYAREVMQLFSIGLYRLNMDGTVQLDGNGDPIETYTNDDVSGLAKVFTGLSHGGPDTTNNRFWGNTRHPDMEVMPMQMYPQYHSISEKRFLGVTIPAQTSATVASANNDLRIALDTLFNHANTPPFISKQLIQRLVKSNPSPAYVQRVATAFANGTAHGFGSGQRGDMRAVIAAILLDTEARGASGTNDGKLREPILRLAHWGRAFGATSTSGTWLVNNTDSTTSSLGQSPMRSVSVFNFYRPGYVPPNTNIATANLVAPEFQITHETSVAGYLNFMQGVVERGVGASVSGQRDVRPNYSAEIALANNSAALVDRINLLVMGGNMKTSTRTTIQTAVDAITISTTNTTAADTARRQRVYLAVFLAMASPEYLSQK